MRVLQLSWEHPPVVYGGLGRHVGALSAALAQAGHEVTVVTQAGAGAPAQERTADGVRVLRVPDDPPLVPRSDLMAWVLAFDHALLRTAIASGPYDVVHAHDWLVAHAAAACKSVLGLPLVATVHATEAGRHQGWLTSELSTAIHSTEWWLTYEARRVITCSAAMRWEVTRLFDLPPDSVDVVPNGVESALWSSRRGPRGPDGPLLVCAARLEYEKGVHVLLRALPRLRRRHPGLHLVIAGTGTYEAELRALARSLRLGRGVSFTGRLATAELAALLGRASVAVVPSIYEPFGMVALEAAAAGAPLVVSDVGGLHELVEDGVDGVRVPPGDVGALADAVGGLLADEVRAGRLARTARQRARSEHIWAAVAARTAEVYARAAREERTLQDRLRRGAAAPSLRVVVRDGNLLAGERP